MISLEKWFHSGIGVYCGFMFKEDTAKKLAKILYKHEMEVKKFFADNSHEIELDNWGMIEKSSDKKEYHYYHYLQKGSEEEKFRRLMLFNKQKIIEHIETVIIAEDYIEAKTIAKEHFSKLE